MMVGACLPSTSTTARERRAGALPTTSPSHAPEGERRTSATSAFRKNVATVGNGESANAATASVAADEVASAAQAAAMCSARQKATRTARRLSTGAAGER